MPALSFGTGAPELLQRGCSIAGGGRFRTEYRQPHSH
jgi:hypothetical protein